MNLNMRIGYALPRHLPWLLTEWWSEGRNVSCKSCSHCSVGVSQERISYELGNAQNPGSLPEHVATMKIEGIIITRCWNSGNRGWDKLLQQWEPRSILEHTVTTV
jgi:hypothetical protein